VEHEPRGFLGDADGAMDFVGANAVLVVGNHPNGSQPLIEANGAVLKDRTDLHGELASGVLGLALPNPTGGDKPDIRTSAGGAYNAVWPTQIDHEVKANIGIGEVANCLD
jgi:hypothetical protein